MLILFPVLEHDVHGRKNAFVTLKSTDTVGIGHAVANLTGSGFGSDGDLNSEDGRRFFGLQGLVRVELGEGEDGAAALRGQGGDEVLGISQLFPEDGVALVVVEVASGEDEGLAEAVDLVRRSSSTSAPLN